MIEQKIGALDQAAPLPGWDLPDSFISLRRLLEARMCKSGKREYVQVLRLLESFRLDELTSAVDDALRLGAELLFEVFSQRYEHGSTLVTTNLPFDEWAEVLGSERPTDALLDRLTRHVNILEMNGDSYRLNQSRERQIPTAN